MFGGLIRREPLTSRLGGGRPPDLPPGGRGFTFLWGPRLSQLAAVDGAILW